MEFKQKGESIRGKYQVLSAFPFVEGVLYFAALTDPDQADSSTPSTRFIHALKLKKQMDELDLKELLNRNEDIFFPVEEVFVEEGILYQVFEKMEGNLLGIYLLQSAPLSLVETADILKKITTHLMNCYDRGQFALVDPQNIVITKAGQIRFLYGGPKKLLSYEYPEAEDVKKVGSLLYTMLTKKHADEQTGQIEPLRQERQDVPLELEGLLMRALSPDPMKRPRTQDFWRWALRYEERESAALEEKAKSAPAISPPAKEQVKAKKPLRGEQPSASQSGSKRPVKLILGTVAALALVVYLISQLFSDSVDPALAGILDPSVEQDEEQALQYFEASNQAYEQKKLNEAVVLARKALSANPEQPEYYLHLANLFGAARDYTNGKKTLEAAVNKFPQTAKFYDALSIFAYYLKDYGTAKQAIEQAIQLDGKQALYYYHQGKILAALKQNDKAMESLRQAVKLEPDQARFNHDFALYLFRTGNLEEAIEAAKKAADSAKEDQEVYYLDLAILYFKKIERIANDPAITPEQKSKTLDPLVKEERLAIDKALKINSYYGKAYYCLSVINYYGNRLISANVAALKAVKINPKNHFYQYQLGLTYMALKKKEEAIQAFEQAVELEPNNFRYKKALAKAQVMGSKP
ncbi:tetratricopeptide repeat protein [Lihuaxuella thermophila]|uniref:Tetratricopeptide repeat-containing protein n=1 Tax=Lihuaxuella thermophila TaxID=1173111 RepID=A0A1H8HSH6_9BACL|nr:tetratricopeptide repeat protein [Lihuaxuella thermophila]SEN59074.1 Tetratricopeptide repeat-containing protein [Lihuaxuella thermophila]